MLTRLIDFLKTERITTLFTSLTSNDSPESSEAAISSLMDTWLLVRNVEQFGERNRALYVLKSRGMAHSNQVREFRLTNKGIVITEPRRPGSSFANSSTRVAESRTSPGTENLVSDNGVSSKLAPRTKSR